ncbi:MAG: hypothetical protein IE887_02705 [Campylobacterales bacterium]|nr:hypothetical protein [Campylobacterales bacterium]
MKFLKWFGGGMVVLLAGIYVLAFTSLGNSIVAPIVEKKIQETTQLDAKLQTFSLRLSSIDLVLYLDPDNSVAIKGGYSLFTQSFDLNYAVDLKKLSSLEKVAQAKLSGEFSTTGTIKGDAHFLTIEGKSDLAKSTTVYHVELNEFNPTSIIAKIENADLSTLLSMAGQKQYASAKIDLDMNFKNIKPHQLDGDVQLLTTNGKLNTAVMKKDFAINIPQTDFKMKLDAKLLKDDLIYTYLFNSNLANISSEGRVVPEPLELDLKYALNIEELAVLKPITNADIRGTLRLSGTAKGSQEKLLVDAKTDIADSNTKVSWILKEFKPTSVVASIKHLKLQKLLYMIKQPHYADANFDMDAKLTSLDVKNLQGTIATKITEGVVDSEYMTKTYGFKSMMPLTIFNAATLTKLEKTLIDTQIDFNSNLADLDISSAKFDLQDRSIKSDYKAKAHDLNRLFFVTQRVLKGSIVALGDLKYGKDLDFTLVSNIAGGKLDAKLHNDDFSAKLANMQTLEVLDMLIYPKIFSSKIDADFKYNLGQASGTFVGKVKDGKFTSNQILDLTKQYAKIDLYKQAFTGDIKADIKKELITALLDLKSNTSSIYTKDTKLNSKTKQIDSNIKIIANNNPPIYVKLQGLVEAPKIKVDASAIVKDEAKKVINKEVNKLFKKLF